MNILNDFKYYWDNAYLRNMDISKNNEIKEYISNFIQKFDDFVSNT